MRLSANPQGLGMITLRFVVLQEGILPINFGLIARKHGMHAAESSFPEIPGRVLLSLLPTEVAYMAEGGVPSSVDGSL